MAKKTSTSKKTISTPAARTVTPAPAAAPVATTPVRNTAIPKVVTPARREVTHEQIAKRAFEIFSSGTGGSEVENWLRAERELKGL